MKKNPQQVMSYFTPEGLHLLLAQPDTTTRQGRRDHALLVDLRVRDIRFEEPATVTLKGKGRKTRIAPLSSKTATILEQYRREKGWIGSPAALDFPLFENSRRCKLTRAGVAHILRKYTEAARNDNGGFIPQTVLPHCLRHSKAVHLLRSGVPLIYIRDFLGYVSVITTEIYAKVDSEERRKALEKAYEIPSQELVPNWETDKGLMAWLAHLCQ